MEPIGIHTIINASMLTMLVVVAASAILVRNLMTSTLLLAIFSLLMAGMYLSLGAPDVAMTEAAVGAGISTILLLAVLLLTGDREKKSAHPVLPVIVIAITAAALIYATLGMPAYDDPAAPTNLHVVPYYLQQSLDDIGIPNVVTSILASYRGYDTLGETFVIFTAGISVLLLLGKDKKSRTK